MRSVFGNVPVVEHRDLVGELNGRHPMCDKHRCTICDNMRKAIVYFVLRRRVKRCSRLIEQVDRAVMIQRAGDSYLLPLAARRFKNRPRTPACRHMYPVRFSAWV